MTEESPRDVQRLHREAFVANIHGDYGIEFALDREERGGRGIVGREYVPKLRTGGVDFEFYTVGGDHRIFTQDDDLTRGTLRSLDHAIHELELETDQCVITRSRQDIDEARRQGKIAFLLTIEGAAPIQRDLSLLRTFYRLGLRSVILTWFRSNPSADGVGELRNGGLTNFGREVVGEMNRLGMVIDVCQCAPATIADVLDASSAPVICSHANASGQYPHVRNLTDSQIKQIAAGGGVVGLTSFPAHIGQGRVTIEHFLDHFDYVYNLVGDDHISVGLNVVVHKASKAQNFYVNSDIEYTDLWLPGLEDVDQLENLTAGLVRRGYAEASIRKILGDNILRVLDEVLVLDRSPTELPGRDLRTDGREP